MADKLNASQRAFVAAYLKSKNATEAAKKAGYSEKSAASQGARLLKNRKVSKVLEAALKKVEDEAEVSASYVLKNLIEVVERCMQRAPVLVFGGADVGMIQAQDEDGRNVWQFDARGANKALELLGKYKKLFTEKVDVLLVKKSHEEWVEELA